MQLGLRNNKPIQRANFVPALVTDQPNKEVWPMTFKNLQQNSEERKDFYVYAYLDPRKPGDYQYGEYRFDYEPFYIGKGQNRRYHLGNFRNIFFSYKTDKIYKDVGIDPILMKVVSGVTEKESLEIEEILIISIGRRFVGGDGPLVNLANNGRGSSGIPMSEETKRKISERAKERGPHSEEHKKRIGDAERGEKHYYYGKHRSEGTKRKISMAHMGCKRSLESRQKQSKTITGSKRVFTKEHCENLSKTQRGKVRWAYRWMIIDPDGKEFEIVNLSKFCRENNLNASNMCAVSRGREAPHKGWRCYRIFEDKS